MITFIALGFIICTAFFVGVSIEDKDSIGVGGWLGNFLTSYVLIGACYVLIGGIVFGAITSEIASKWEYGWENKIVAMQDNKAYIVSRHNGESSDRYYYMVDYGDGHYKQHWVSQNRSDIYEIDGSHYVIKTYNKVINPSNWFMKDLEKFRNAITENERRWEFYVPKGSVVQDFTLDLR